MILNTKSRMTPQAPPGRRDRFCVFSSPLSSAFGEKSCPSQGKIKSFFKIAVALQATAKRSSQTIKPPSATSLSRLSFTTQNKEYQMSRAIIPIAALTAAIIVFSSAAFAKGGGNGAGVGKPPGYTGHGGTGARVGKPPGYTGHGGTGARVGKPPGYTGHGGTGARVGKPPGYTGHGGTGAREGKPAVESQPKS
jgi:hypothetical protein